MKWTYEIPHRFFMVGASLRFFHEKVSTCTETGFIQRLYRECADFARSEFISLGT